MEPSSALPLQARAADRLNLAPRLTDGSVVPPWEPAVPNDALPIRTDLHLLARVRFRDSSGEARECFGNILELGPRTMRLESGRPLETGCQIQLQVAFPGQRQYARRLVLLSYVVRGPHDEPNLHYDLVATTQEKESQERLSLYLRRDPSRAGVEA